MVRVKPSVLLRETLREKFPGSTEVIRKWFHGLFMKASDRDPALDLPFSETVKDGMKKECEDSIRPLTRNVESPFHQTEIHSLQWTVTP